jgi:phage baseplate assembly protein gpV
VSGHTNPFLVDVAVHQLTALTRTSELTSLYSLIAFSLISATLSVGASGVASSDGTVDVDADLIEIGEPRAVNAVDRSAVNGVNDRRISMICL